jgi:hypothetical protein
MINPKDHPHSTPNRFSVRHELPKIARRKSYVRDLLDWRKDVNRLQEVSSETEETSKAGTGHGESLVGTGSWDRGRWRWGWNIGGSDGSTWGGGWDSRWCWGGSVGGWVHWCWGRDTVNKSVNCCKTVLRNSMGYQVLQYTTEVV